MKSSLLIATCVLSVQLMGQEHLAYIEEYRDVAVSEMHRTGIPASIKLAQAILESSGGKSTLARRANNHFGMKCGSSWGGRKMHRKDDDRNDRGKLIESCFRVFESGHASFIAHSEFLRDPKKSGRYGFLFDIQPDDYEGWAKGLKRAGYATNPRYPQLLMKLIEDYALHEYDKAHPEQFAAADQFDQSVADKSNRASISAAAKTYTVLYNNNVKFVLAYQGDNVNYISRNTGVSASRLLRYNEYIDHPHQILGDGDKVYIQPKRKKYKGDQKFHVVRTEETIDGIAQTYGMLSEALYHRNSMPEGSEPAVGEVLVLRGKNKRSVALRSEQSPMIERVPQHEQRGIFLDEITAPSPHDEVVAADDDRAERPPVPRPAPDTEAGDMEVSPTYGLLPAADYIVQQSDTLYQIARVHGLSVGDLKKINNLQGDTIRPGQVLKLGE